MVSTYERLLTRTHYLRVHVKIVLTCKYLFDLFFQLLNLLSENMNFYHIKHISYSRSLKTVFSKQNSQAVTSTIMSAIIQGVTKIWNLLIKYSLFEQVNKKQLKSTQRQRRKFHSIT